VRTDSRWPIFDARAAHTSTVVSMLTHRLFLEDGDTVAALTLYSRKAAAFSSASVPACTILATHGAIAVTAEFHHPQNPDLRLTPESNRTIGVAIGIVMGHHHVTEPQAFDLIRIESQHTHRAVISIATGVVSTGQLNIDAEPVRTSWTKRPRADHTADPAHRSELIRLTQTYTTALTDWIPAYIRVKPTHGTPVTDREYLKLQRHKSNAAAALEQHSPGILTETQDRSR
jgi:hypothetical protein